MSELCPNITIQKQYHLEYNIWSVYSIFLIQAIWYVVMVPWCENLLKGDNYRAWKVSMVNCNTEGFFVVSWQARKAKNRGCYNFQPTIFLSIYPVLSKLSNDCNYKMKLKCLCNSKSIQSGIILVLRVHYNAVIGAHLLYQRLRKIQLRKFPGYKIVRLRDNFPVIFLNQSFLFIYRLSSFSSFSG